jgi:hypothetical protein
MIHSHALSVLRVCTTNTYYIVFAFTPMSAAYRLDVSIFGLRSVDVGENKGGASLYIFEQESKGVESEGMQ